MRDSCSGVSITSVSHYLSGVCRSKNLQLKSYASGAQRPFHSESPAHALQRTLSVGARSVPQRTLSVCASVRSAVGRQERRRKEHIVERRQELSFLAEDRKLKAEQDEQDLARRRAVRTSNCRGEFG